MITPLCPPATGPLAGAMLVIIGVVTVRGDPLLATPPTVTTTFPVLAPAGTTATIDVALQLVIDVAVVPLKVIVLVPCVAPKLEPLIVTEVPTAPEVGERLVIEGCGSAEERLPSTLSSAIEVKG